MKSPKLLMLSVLAGSLALLTGCATNDRDYQTTTSSSRGQFFCELCEDYHPLQHSHYPYYEEDQYHRTSPARPVRANVILQPGRETPMGPQPEYNRPVRPVD